MFICIVESMVMKQMYMSACCLAPFLGINAGIQNSQRYVVDNKQEAVEGLKRLFS